MERELNSIALRHARTEALVRYAPVLEPCWSLPKPHCSWTTKREGLVRRIVEGI